MAYCAECQFSPADRDTGNGRGTDMSWHTPWAAMGQMIALIIGQKCPAWVRGGGGNGREFQWMAQ
jgi:hypothetical protein